MLLVKKTLAVAIVLIVTACCAFAAERTGTLVFDAVKELQQNHRDFVSRAGVYKARYNRAIALKDRIRKRFDNSEPGSLDRAEIRAGLAKAVAAAYDALLDEVSLAHEVGEKHLLVLYKLRDSIERLGGGGSDGPSTDAVQALAPFVENGKKLLLSLAGYKDMVDDPAVVNKLNQAYDTALLIESYQKQLAGFSFSEGSGHGALKRKMEILIDQLGALYSQTCIYKDLIGSKRQMLEAFRKTSEIQLSMSMATRGKGSVGDFSRTFVNGISHKLDAVDRDLDRVVGFGPGPAPDGKSGDSHRWTRIEGGGLN